MNEKCPKEALPADSPFYPIARRRLLLETQRCVAFLDKHPVAKGHSLVVAKTVTPSLFDLPTDVQTEVWETVRRVREMLIRRFKPDRFNIGINDGPASGQTVAHAHVHIIPRYANDVPDPRGGIRRILAARARY